MALFVVDGTFELFRAHYAAPPSTSPAGRQVGASRGLLRSLAALVARSEVIHVACAFDHVIESFRNRLFAGYKTAEGIDPVLYSQFGLAERVAAALGMTVWPMVEFEADDAMATAAHRFAAGVERVVLCSPDKDLAQCVRGSRITTWDRVRNRTFDEQGVVAKFGVAPGSIPDYLALVGDAADGLPGIPRWGAKSSATVLAYYEHLEAIPRAPGSWAVKVRGAESLSAALETHRDAALLYRTLATLRTDVPLQEGLEQLTYRGPDRDRLQAVCEELDEDPARILGRLAHR